MWSICTDSAWLGSLASVSVMDAPEYGSTQVPESTSWSHEPWRPTVWGAEATTSRSSTSSRWLHPLPSVSVQASPNAALR